MADPVVQGTEWGEYLARLDEEGRERARRAARQALVANQPDDEGKPPVRTLGEYLDHKLETPPVLVYAPEDHGIHTGLLCRGAITAMVAKGGKGKTAVSLNKIIRWSMGKPLFDDLPALLAPEAPVRSLLIENEGSAWHFQKVLRTILTHEEAGFSAEEQQMARDNIGVWGDGGWSGLKLDNEENIAMVRKAIEATKADLVFIEPFRGLWTGEENSSTEMAGVLDSLSGLANQYECAIYVTHHERKAGDGDGGDPMDAARGSVVFSDLAAVMESWRPVKAGRQRELAWPKSRFGPAPGPVRMQWVPERWGYRWVEEDEQLRSVLGAFGRFPDDWLTVSAVAEELDESQNNVRRWLKKGVDSGDLKVKNIEHAQHFKRVKSREAGDEEGLAIT